MQHGLREGLLEESSRLGQLQRWKRRALALLIASFVLVTLACALRWIPRWNDILSGRPRYLRALTIITAQDLAEDLHYQMPVILMGEDDRCDALSDTGLTEDQIIGELHILTWSERAGFSCITTYAIPKTPSRFSHLRTFRPGEGEPLGGSLTQAVSALPISRQLHVFPPQYIQRLHWRFHPHFPIPKDQIASLTPQHSYSLSDPALLAKNTEATLNIDFQEARALIAQKHDRVTLILSWILVCSTSFVIVLAAILAGLYTSAS